MSQTLFEQLLEKVISCNESRWDDILNKQRELEGLIPAIRDPKTGKIYTGYSHRDAIDSTLMSSRPYSKWGYDTQNVGFITRAKVFITRDEAEERWNVATIEDVRNELDNNV